jgi:phosphohistidine phosphatase SixA
MRILLLSFLLGCGLSQATPVTVILTRHAEPAAQPAGNPGLSAAGRDRARQLAEMLADSGVNAIYATEYLRTQQTAQPTADRLKLKTQIVKAADEVGLVQALRHGHGSVLVVGHSDTIPAVIAALGGPPVTMGEMDFGNLFVLALMEPGPGILHLRYGQAALAAGVSGGKAQVMEIDFLRSGGFAGAATQVDGKVVLSNGGGEVTSGSGYRRQLSGGEASILSSGAAAAQQSPPNGPGAVRDGYQYDIHIRSGDAQSRSVTLYGEASAKIAGWIAEECQRIWDYRAQKAK